MTFLIPVLILLAAALAMTLLFGRTLVETFATASFSVILCLYLGGLAGSLHAGLALVFAGTLGLWVLAWRRKLLNGQELLAHRQEWLRSLWVILPMLLLVFTLTMGREFIHIDEYSHWGVAAKDLYLYDKFYCIPEASTLFKDYIPGTTLFEYFFAVFGPYKSENVYRGLDVLLIACLTPAFKNTVKKGGSRTHIFVGWALFLILLYSNFSDVFTLLQVDAALAVMTANLLLTWFGDETKDSFTVAQLALSAMVLTMTKGSGIVQLLLALAVIGADAVLCRKSEKGLWRAPAAALAAMAFTWGSWRICTALYGVVASRSQGSGMLSGLLALLGGTAQEYQKTTAYNFYTAFFEKGYMSARNTISYFQWTFVLAAAAFVVSLFLKNKRRGRMLMAVLPLVHLVYSVLLLLSYVLSFSQGEAVSLASIYRYMPACYGGLLLFLAGWLLILVNDEETQDEKTRHLRWCTPVLVCALAFFSLNNWFLRQGLLPPGPAHNADTVQAVAPYQALRQLSEEGVGEKTVCLLRGETYIDTTQYSVLVSRCELAPLDTTTYIVTEESSPQEVSGALLQADYVFVLPLEGLFTEGAAALLPEEITPQPGVLYKVDAEQGTFVPVG